MRKLSLFLVFAFLLVAAATPNGVLADGGNILYLIAWGGYAPNTTVTVQTTVQAIPDRINNSNLYYTITGPNNSIVATHSTDLNRLEPYQTITDEWSTTNSGWPAGWYTISVCWSTGNSHSCKIAGPTETTVWFVPSLGWGLSLAALALLLIGLWRRRAFFRHTPIPVKR